MKNIAQEIRHTLQQWFCLHDYKLAHFGNGWVVYCRKCFRGR